MSKIVNRAELAEICDVSLPTIDAWRRKGCPYIQRPSTDKAASAKKRQWLYDTGKVIWWLQLEARKRW